MFLSFTEKNDKHLHLFLFRLNSNGQPICTQPTTHSTQCQPYVPMSSSPYEITSETVNYFRLARLLLDICNNVMRDLMKSKIPGGEINLTKRIGLCKNDLKHLHDVQKKIIFPPNNGLVRYESLDFTLMYALVRNVFHEEIEKDSKRNQKWGKSPAPSDNSLLAAIERIRGFRNTFFAHPPSTEIKDPIFKDLWTQIQGAVDTISGHIHQRTQLVDYKMEMKNLKKRATDPEVEKFLEKWCKSEKKLNDLLEMEGSVVSFFLIFLKVNVTSTVFIAFSNKNTIIYHFTKPILLQLRRI